MGRRKKFIDDELFNVVIDYENEKGTPFSRRDVAEFAKKNARYNGKYQDIKDFHFNVQKAPNASAEIDRWHRERNGMSQEGRNVLLYSENDDEFFKLSLVAQKEIIKRTRKYVLLKESKIRNQELTILDLMRKNNDYQELEKVVDNEINKLNKEIKNLRRVIKYLIETVDETTQERLLEMEISYKEKIVQLEDTHNFLINKKDKLFNLDDQLKKIRSLNDKECEENMQNNVKDIKNGELDFKDVLPHLI